MSRIFDALKRAADTQGDVLRILQNPERRFPAFDDDHAAPPPVAGLQAAPAPEAAPPPEPAFRVQSLRLSSRTPTFPFDGSEPNASEQYRLVRTRILHDPRAPRMLLISSPSAGDGKTITAINIAAALALKADSSVLLVDGDLRRPSVSPMLGIPSTPGLGDVLEGSSPLERAIITIAETPQLHVLPTNRTNVNPTELLDSGRWGSVCASLRRAFRYVVVDSPPISIVADYELLEKSCDGVIVVVRPDHTNRSLIYKVLESVPREKQMGVVVNCMPKGLLFRRTQSYYYGAQ